MKRMRIVEVIVVGFVVLVLVLGTNTPSAAQKSNPHARKRSTITGCLTKSTNDTYQLVDQKGQTNMVYSTSVALDSYVGQSVTLVGNQSTTPTTDSGTAHPMPHFVVLEVHPAASGTCK